MELLSTTISDGPQGACSLLDLALEFGNNQIALELSAPGVVEEGLGHAGGFQCCLKPQFVVVGTARTPMLSLLLDSLGTVSFQRSST